MSELGLFTGLRKKPFNAITSSLQQQALDVPREGSRRIEDDLASPMKRLFASVMRGNAQVQGQARAKRIANDQADAASKASLSWNNDGTITIKHAPPDLLMKLNDGSEDFENAASGPAVAVEAAVASTPAAAAAPAGDDPLATSYRAIDSHMGYRVPRPSDPDVMQKLSTPEGIRQLTREMGGTKAHEKEILKRLQSGDTSIEQMRERVAAFRAQRLSAIYSTIRAPLDDAQQDARLTSSDRVEARRDFDQFLRNNLADIGTEDEAVQVARERAESAGHPWNTSREKEVRSTYRGQSKKADTAREERVRQRINGMKDDAIAAYGGDYNQWLANQEAELGLFSTEQNRDAKALFTGISKKIRDKEEKAEKAEAASASREARAFNVDIRRVEAAERAAREEERRNRREESAEVKEERKLRQAEIDKMIVSLKENNKRILENNINFAKEVDPVVQKAFQEQNKGLIAANVSTKAELERMGLRFATPSKPAAATARQAATAPAKTGKYTAVHPETKQTIVSNDGVTWFDAVTGKKVQ